MLQGKDAVAFVESLVVGDVQALKNGTGSLSVITNDAGGIIDDTVITKVTDTEIYMVLNAGCRDKDLEHINKHLAAFSGTSWCIDQNARHSGPQRTLQ
jgi:aminomethyltransferase